MVYYIVKIKKNYIVGCVIEFPSRKGKFPLTQWEVSRPEESRSRTGKAVQPSS